MHLNAERLIDLVEGRTPESSEVHLRECETCRQQLVELRRAMTMVEAVEIPEPSPLFWDHFSERVGRAIATEPAPRRSFWDLRWTAVGIGAVAALAVVVLAVALRAPSPNGRSPVLMSTPATAGSTAALAIDPADASGIPGLLTGDAADDTSLALVADLASQLDSEAVLETGLAGDHPGGVDEVVSALSGSERLELQRILKAELAKS